MQRIARCLCPGFFLGLLLLLAPDGAFGSSPFNLLNPPASDFLVEYKLPVPDVPGGTGWDFDVDGERAVTTVPGSRPFGHPTNVVNLYVLSDGV